MDFGIRGKVAVVGGASRGIGRACAESLAREGATLVLVARTAGDLERTAFEIRTAHGVAVHPHAADLSRAGEIDGLFAAVASRFGGADILVNNTGGPPPGTFDTAPDAAWQAAFEGTLMSAVRASRAAAAGMRTRGWGRIVTIVSTSVRQPIPTLVLSNSIRLAVVGMAKSLSRELAPSGVTVNCVLPGRVDTDRYRELVLAAAAREGRSEEAVAAEHRARVPLGRFASPAEVADAVAFLCSEPARYITGIALPVDGGLIDAPL